MASFDQIREKFIRGGNTVFCTLRHGAELFRLFIQRWKLRCKQRKQFEALGRCIYESKDRDTMVSGNIVEKLDDYARRLTESKARSMQLRRQWCCPACGAVMGRRARFCSACGEAMPENTQK